jgi:hypothetical protein
MCLKKSHRFKGGGFFMDAFLLPRLASKDLLSMVNEVFEQLGLYVARHVTVILLSESRGLRVR